MLREKADMYNPLISVIIPVYNTQKYLNRCLGSIVQNTYSNFEVICINDGSTDESQSILEKWAENDRRVRVITIPNSGLSNARNTGMKYAKGELVGFIDSDDWVHPKYFEVLLRAFNDYDVDISVCERIITETFLTEYNEIVQPTFQLIDAETFTRNKYVKTYAWGRLYKRELLTKFNTKLAIEDRPFNFEIIHKNPNTIIGYTKSTGYYYFIREDSLIHMVTNDKWFQMAEYYLVCLKKAIDNNDGFGIRLYFEDAMKSVLSFRYLAASDERWSKKRKWITKKAIVLIDKTGSVISKKRKIMYFVFLSMPVTYSAFRMVVESPIAIKLKNRFQNSA